MKEPMAAVFNDTARFADVVARCVPGDFPPDIAIRAARIKLAKLRREAWPLLTTWAPGDPAPESWPTWGLYDVGGLVWHGRADGLLRLSLDDRTRLAQHPEWWMEKALAWGDLLLLRGPLTRRQAPQVQRAT
ncbi:hypothetical protein [Goodfellowiella coeruleoviolacea]|uniref:Uncharacterized protein n=1 Tax=Goodfellowiella coeruleoviolacea TaxID=334858 RepID=A0AAE3KJJ5_9PSEU|nr:hypothetical protein [Goodfellowiella coeruleoviolacea]MCP2169700.1 hypothetical protein [Goodfellowiella coeruleoviolacea]